MEERHRRGDVAPVPADVPPDVDVRQVEERQQAMLRDPTAVSGVSDDRREQHGDEDGEDRVRQQALDATAVELRSRSVRRGGRVQDDRADEIARQHEEDVDAGEPSPHRPGERVEDEDARIAMARRPSRPAT